MKSKIRAGILSGLGLIGINIITGIFLIPSVIVSNEQLVSFTLQIGVLWFGISLWIVLRYTLVCILNLKDFSKILNSTIFLIASIGAINITATILPIKELYAGSFLLKIILLINYLIIVRKVYYLDKQDMKNVGDLHNWALSIITVAIIVLVLTFLNELSWHIEINWLFHFLNALPIIFLIQFFKHLTLELNKDNNACA